MRSALHRIVCGARVCALWVRARACARLCALVCVRVSVEALIAALAQCLLAAGDLRLGRRDRDVRDRWVKLRLDGDRHLHDPHGRHEPLPQPPVLCPEPQRGVWDVDDIHYAGLAQACHHYQGPLERRRRRRPPLQRRIRLLGVRRPSIWPGDQLLELGAVRRGLHVRPVRLPLLVKQRCLIPLPRPAVVSPSAARPDRQRALATDWLDDGRLPGLRPEGLRGHSPAVVHFGRLDVWY